jgi:hypothetical protein
MHKLNARSEMPASTPVAAAVNPDGLTDFERIFGTEAADGLPALPGTSEDAPVVADPLAAFDPFDRVSLGEA